MAAALKIFPCLELLIMLTLLKNVAQSRCCFLMLVDNCKIFKRRLCAVKRRPIYGLAPGTAASIGAHS